MIACSTTNNYRDDNPHQDTNGEPDEKGNETVHGRLFECLTFRCRHGFDGSAQSKACCDIVWMEIEPDVVIDVSIDVAIAGCESGIIVGVGVGNDVNIGRDCVRAAD